MESFFQNTLTDLVKALRSTSLGEAAFLEAALADCKREIRSTDPHIKATALQKVTYIAMLQGSGMEWASFHCLEVMSQARFWHKQAGYLALCHSFTGHSDLLLLATNLFKKDLASQNEYEAAQALNALSRVLTPSLARDLLPDVCRALLSGRLAVRKRAVLVLHHFFRADPDTAPHSAFKALVDSLNDSETSVVCCAVNVLCELVCSSSAPSAYLPLAPPLFALLTRSSHTWLVIKLVKLFAVLAPLEPRLAARLAAPLTAILERTPAKSLAYECVRTATASLPHHPEVMALCGDKLREFIQDEDANLRYLGLLALERLLPGQAAVVAPHHGTALACLSDADPTIQAVALRLVRALVATPDDAALVSEALLRLVRGGAVEPDFQFQLMAALLDLNSRDHYALVADFAWYVSVLVELAAVPGSPHGGAVAAQLEDLALRVPDCRPDLVHHARDLLLAPSLLRGGPAHPTVSAALGAAAWITGEYAEHVRDPRGVLEALLQPNVTALPAGVQAVIVQAILKLLLHARAASSGGAASAAANAAPTVVWAPLPSTSALRAIPPEQEDAAGNPAEGGGTPDELSGAEEALPTSSNQADRAGPAAAPQLTGQDGSSDVGCPDRRGTPESSEPHVGEAPPSLAGSLEQLVRAHLGPLLESGHSAVQERAGNVAALLYLAATPTARGALHRLAAAQKEELRPVAPHAQAMVEVPPGLPLDTSLAGLAGLRAEYGMPGPPEWGPEARAREDAAAERPQTVDEGQASEDARAARAAHRQRHGQHYLANDERAPEQDTGQEKAAGATQQAPAPAPKRKPARAIVKLDEDLPPGVVRWRSGEGLPSAGSLKGGVLDQSVASLLAGKHGSAGEEVQQEKRSRSHRSKHRGSQRGPGSGGTELGSEQLGKERTGGRRQHKHHSRRSAPANAQEKEGPSLASGTGHDLPPLISFEHLSRPVT